MNTLFLSVDALGSVGQLSEPLQRKTTTNQLRSWCRTSILSELTLSVSSHSEEKELPVVTPNKKKEKRGHSLYWVWQVNQFKGAGSGGEIFHHPDLCFYIWRASVSTHGCACIIDFTAGAEFPTWRSALKKQHNTALISQTLQAHVEPELTNNKTGALLHNE